MAFDSTTRNKLAGMIAEARELLDKEFTEQFQQIYGTQPDGTIIDIEKLKHLDEQQTDTARLLRERIEHLISGMVGERKAVVVAVERIIREQAFTILNRFTALRMCEERGFVEECVRAGMQSKGFKVYESIAGAGLGGAYERYKTFLFCQFDEIAVDLGVLFDRFSPEGLLFPREQALVGLLKIINKEDLKKIWVEDETIGWVYQYFNSKEEREAMRKASAAPRNSRELAVRNQFFTPRYVVEFLTDNTLGRIWYEMRRGETVLREVCHYLVRRPSEIFLAPGEKAPIEEDHEDNLTQEELLKKPVYIEHRPKKDPRDIRGLDLACGSGHFLLYAFDLLEKIYVEAWEDPECPKSYVTGRTLREDYTSLEELRRVIPDLILRWNLHGIDIDPRCAQIASLALWLRAQKSWQKQGLKAGDRPRVTKSNIVTAEPMPGEEEMRREFIAGLKPRVLGQLVDVVFEKMKLAGEAGSLLKIEEEIKEVVAGARKQWEKSPEMEQVALFSHLIKQQPKQEKLRFDVKGITDESFWDQAEERILASLRDYAERVENGRTMRRRLFFEDAARGFAFIDLCRKRYDVVLMNPPFGEASSTILAYLEKQYPHWTKNLLCAAIYRALEFIYPKGFLGVIFDRTAAIKSSYENFRTGTLDVRIFSVADTGWGVLDANVETTVHVLTAKGQEGYSTFFDIREYNPDIKANQLERRITNANAGDLEEGTYIVKPKTFLRLPNAIVGYYFDELLLNLFDRWHNLSEATFQARQGHALVSDEHFRLFWELSSPVDIGEDKSFSFLYNGAEFSLFASPNRDVTKYGDGGCLVASNKSVVLRNPDYQFLSGVGYGKRGEIIDAHVLSSGSIFTSEGQAITGIQKDDAKIVLSFLNSSLAQYTINQYCGQHKHCGYINLLPIPSLQGSIRSEIIGNAEKIVEIKQRWFAFDETTLEFRLVLFGLNSWTAGNSLRDLLDAVVNKFKTDKSELRQRIANNDRYFKQAACLSSEESEQLDRYILRRPLDSPWPDMERDRASESESVFLTKTLISQIIGLVFGRWDVRIALDTSLAPKLADPFDPLPVCPPGMLVGLDGLPAKPGGNVSEEWLRARPNAITLPREGSVKKPTILDSEYPLRISWNGILVDDPGLNESQPHNEDIVRRMREVLDLIWKDRSEAIEHEACQILGVRSLRDYFRKPSNFFHDHLKRYSKSRRQAPIYWPLSTKTGSYILWVYYHRLTDQTLYTCVNDYLNPKLTDVSKDIERLRREISEGGGTKKRQSLEELMDFEEELKEFRDELLRVAHLPYKPNLNDGVIITAAPLYKLFRHNQWRKDLEECWRKLESGENDWAHLAYTIWPDRVREKCKKDRSIAIAHGLEELYEGESPKDKKQKKKKKA